MEYKKHIEALEKNLKEKLKYIASKVDSMTCKQMHGASVVSSGLPSDTFNTVLGGKIDEKTCENIVSYYEKNHLPFAWWIRSDTYSSRERVCLEKQGLTCEEQETGMVCDLTEVIEKHRSSSLVVRMCKDYNDYIDFAEVLASIFSPPDEYVKIFYEKVATLKQDQMLFFVGYENKSPVSTSCLFLTDVIGIYDIATRPEKRRRGYGSSMFHQALVEARQRGYKIAALQASLEGIEIYKRFGFQQVCSFDIWNKEFNQS